MMFPGDSVCTAETLQRASACSGSRAVLKRPQGHAASGVAALGVRPAQWTGTTYRLWRAGRDAPIIDLEQARSESVEEPCADGVQARTRVALRRSGSTAL